MTLSKELEIFRGDSFPITMTLRDSETLEPIDLTGYSALMTVNSEQFPTDASNQLWQTAGALDADPTTGIVVFTPSTSDTDQDPGTYFYDVQITNGVTIRTVVKSTLDIKQDITK